MGATITAAEARALAADWLSSADLDGLRSAYLVGSMLDLAAADPLPPWSDVDLMVVVDRPSPLPKVGKLDHRGLLLDVTLLAADQMASPQVALADYHLAPGLRRAQILTDHDGGLARLSAQVAAEFAQPEWVERRCAHALARIVGNLDGAMVAALPWPQRVMAWLFGAAVAAHVLLVAGRRDPTVRRRYVATARMLGTAGLGEVQEELLDLLGCARLSAAQVAAHLAALEPAFDAAATAASAAGAAGGEQPWRSDITLRARPIAIEGSRALIEAGWHREAVFWLAATFCRCCLIAPREPLAVDGLAALLADLGVADDAALAGRVAQARAYLPRLRELAQRLAQSPATA